MKQKLAEWIKKKRTSVNWFIGGWIFQPRGKWGLLFLRVIYSIGCLLTVAGMVTFLSSWLRDKTASDEYWRGETPCPIVGHTQLYAQNGRIYLFSEAKTAVNIYEPDGTFLFCIQGPRVSYGMGKMTLYGQEIYMESRNNILLRFDQEGNCLGTATGGVLFSSSGKEIFRCNGTIEHYDDEAVYYSVWSEEEETYVYYRHDLASGIAKRWEPGVNGKVIFPGETHAKYDADAVNGDITYSVSANRLYKIENGERTLLAKTPFLTYYLNSRLTEWLSMMVGGGLMNWAEKRSKKKGCPIHI